MSKLLFIICCFFFFYFQLNCINSQTFKELSSDISINHRNSNNIGGATVFDYDNDGDEDLYLTGGFNKDKLYLNNGDGTFSDRTNFAGLLRTSEVVTTSAVAGDINNDGFRDLFVTTIIEIGNLENYIHNLLYLNNGDGTFSDISESSGIASLVSYSASATLGDFNSDGFLDVYVGNLMNESIEEIISNSDIELSSAPNYLLINNQDNTFSDIAGLEPIRDTGISFQATFIDVNNDHHLDIFCGNDFSGGIYFPNSLFINNSPILSFEDISITSKMDERASAMGIAVADYNEDGWLDIYVTNDGKNSLFKNNGDNTFSNEREPSNTSNALVPIQPSENEVYVSSLIYNHNFTQSGNDTFSFSVCDTLFPNCATRYYVYLDIENNFEEEKTIYLDSFFITQLHIDGQETYNIPTPYGRKVVIDQSPTQGSVSIVIDSAAATAVGWGTNFFDYDNDSHLDLFIANGALNADVDNTNTLFRGIGDGTFEDVSEVTGANNPWPARGSITFDYEQDGDLDVLVVNNSYYAGYQGSQDPETFLMQNNSANNNNWLKVKLKGVESNRDGIGARLIAYVDGRILTRIIDGGSSAMSQSSIIAHFGLNNYTQLDSLQVIWPGGCSQTLLNVGINQTLDILQSCDSRVILSNTLEEKKNPHILFPNPANDFILIKTQRNFQVKSLKVSDTTGKWIPISYQNVEDGLQLDVSYLDAGQYVCHFNDGLSNFSYSFIITR